MITVQKFLEDFTPDNYSLSMTLDRHGRAFSGLVTITGLSRAAAEDIKLHAKDLTINSVTLDGRDANFSHDGDSLLIALEQPRSHEHIVVVDFDGTISDAMHGLYPCYFNDHGQEKELLATQFESHHAREVFPCIDEPSAKATFDVTLTTETGVEVLGNMPVKQQRQENGHLVTTFETSPRMSSYLLAWVVGELHKKSATTASGVEVNIWATPAQPAASLDFALSHAVASIEFFDDYFDTPYPLPKSDHVALPDFSSGAMENWGLVTYREVALLADPSTTTVASKQQIATVVSHELSHQWFGNLVTMKWWNDLWLNESFATLMEYVAVDAIHPEWNAWLDFASHESIVSLRRDAIDGVQPVQVEVSHPDEISTIFDPAIVYAKGARLMRMCQSHIGHEAFRKGLASYFKEFAYQNTAADDLWHHLSNASGKNITSMMNTWISQPGYPVVHVASNGLRQDQFFIGDNHDKNRLWPIPLQSNNQKLPAQLSQKYLNQPITKDTRLNIHDAAHFITNYDEAHLAALLARVATFDELGRLQLLHEQTLLVRAGLASSDQLIDLLDVYKGETAESVWNIMALSLAELKKFVETDDTAEHNLRQLAGILAIDQYLRLGWKTSSGEPESDTKLRSTILSLMVYSEDVTVLKKCDEFFHRGVESIDPEIRSLVIGSTVKRATDITIIEKLLETYRTTQSADLREDICAGLTSAKQPDHIALLLEQMTDKNTVRHQDLFRWFAHLSRSQYARDQAWQWMTSNWQWIVNTFAGDKSYDDFPRYATGGMVSRQQLENYQDFFVPKRDVPALTRAIDLGIKEIKARVKLIERDGKAVREKLISLYD